ncbi:MAG: 2TM domain-containing protein [Rhodospirillales bacterium]|nr:2TM domain-containing protein [Rhodospirillales bacterium]
MTDGKSVDAVPKTAADDADAAAADAATAARLAKRRLMGFGTHLAVFFAAMVVLVPINFFVTPHNPWFVLPMVGWGSLLALHAAYAMGLFGKP